MKQSKFKTITEGAAKLKIPAEEKVSKELPVFYNPVMKLNRDVSVLLLDFIDKKDMQVALPLAGSGVRGIRFLKELAKDKIEEIHFNDINKKACRLIKENLKLNKLKTKKASVSNKDASQFLLSSAGFDYIDIDPFGSPNKFLNAAISRLSRGGILAVTATDTAPLCGTIPKACLRKYWAKPLRNELMHELGLRILIRKIQLVAAQYDKALKPLFSYYKLHYFRLFFSCEKGKQKVNTILHDHAYLIYCAQCMERNIVHDVFNEKKCDCGGMLDYAGPLYVGDLFDVELVKKMFDNVKDNKELYNLMNIIKDESKIGCVGFYDIHVVCKKYNLNVPKLNELISEIKKTNKASRTHFCDVGLKSDIKIKELVSVIKTNA